MKTILVHLDSGEKARERLLFAVTLANKHGAQVVGAFGQRARAEQVGVVFNWPSRDYIEAAAGARKMFEEVTANVPKAEWLDINRGSNDEILKRVANAARYCDLTVVGQNRPAESNLIAEEFPEEVAAMSGRPILLIPHQGQWSQTGLRPLIVWDESAKSARAVKESLQLIQPNTQVTVLSIGVSNSEETKASGNIIGFLASHGISAVSESYESLALEEGSWDLIVSRLASLGNDLLVIGAHKQGGFPFARRDVVRGKSPVPVLMAS